MFATLEQTESQITNANLKWYAVQTYSCRERLVAKSFKAQNITHYLPLLTEKHRWSDRIKTIQVPLFKNYIFVNIEPTQEIFWKVMITKGVTSILGNEKGPISIPTTQIEAITSLMENKITLKLANQFHSGQPVSVKKGPLAGTKGLFLRIKNKDHLAVNIDILGQTVLTEVNYCDVETY